MVDEIIIMSDLIITPLIKARGSLDLALAAPKTDLNRDASIQRFEFTFELAWKTMRRILKYKGILINSPRDTIREAANEDVAEKIYSALPEFKIILDSFIDGILKL